MNKAKRAQCVNLSIVSVIITMKNSTAHVFAQVYGLPFDLAEVIWNDWLFKLGVLQLNKNYCKLEAKGKI